MVILPSCPTSDTICSNAITGEHVYKSLLLGMSILCAATGSAQSPAVQSKLSVHWEELSAAEFRDAITRAQSTCLLPIGIMEKHGPHLPLGNDLLNVRYIALNAAQQEYAVVFPEYYFGQIAEAKHEPGTVAYSRRLQLELLQETTDEMARNGCKKIIIVNGHGGNNSLLPFFAQTQLDTPHDYVVYVQGIMRGGQGEPKHKTNPAKDMHAGESETSVSLIARPRNRVPIRRACPPSRKACTPASGGMRVFPITMRATGPPRPASSATSRPGPGSPGSCVRSARSRRTRRACGCKTNSSSEASCHSRRRSDLRRRRSMTRTARELRQLLSRHAEARALAVENEMDKDVLVGAEDPHHVILRVYRDHDVLDAVAQPECRLL